MSKVRKILGGPISIRGRHCIGKLDNGRYAVGALKAGDEVAAEAQYSCLDTAFDCWKETFSTALLSRLQGRQS